MSKRKTSTSKSSSEPKTYSQPAAQPQRRRYCNFRDAAPRPLPAGVAGERMRLIVMNRSKWVNGTKLRYAFFPSTGQFSRWAGTAALKSQVRKAFDAWSNLGIGLSFEEIADRRQAEVRIGFEAGDGHWSYVGRDVLEQGADDRTMNLDPSDGIANGQYGVDVATHEIGHTIGFPHEHQNPNAGIVWNEEAVYAALAAPPNRWDRATTFHNIIRKISPDEIQGSSWDPDSVMHYPFESGLIVSPAQYAAGLQPAGGLSARDKQWVKTFYPPIALADENSLKLHESKLLQIAPGEQRNFILKPTVTRHYELRTFGQSDTVMVLFVRNGTVDTYLTGDDDSGEDRNAYIRRRLLAGQTYVVRLRLYYAASSGETSIMWW